MQTQEFTTDKTRVLATIERFIGRRCRFQKVPGLNNWLDVETEADKIYSIRVATDVIKALAAHLSKVRGRRITLLWITEGIDYNVQPVLSGARSAAYEPDPAAVNHAMRDAIDVLQRANVTLRRAVDAARADGRE